MTRWQRITSTDPRGREMADRHYSRRTPGSVRFVGPGSPLCLWQPGALWVTQVQRHEFVDHQWSPSWMCSIFRNEGAGLSSELIREALAVTRAELGDPPEAFGMVTFVDAGKVRRKRDPGRCFLRAGFGHLGWTKGGHGRNSLRVLGLTVEGWPEAAPPYSPQLGLWGSVAAAPRACEDAPARTT